MPDAVPLRLQLQCAKRELARRVRVYPGLIAQDILLTSTAVRELAAMTAIVRTLTRLVAADGGGGPQAELFGGLRREDGTREEGGSKERGGGRGEAGFPPHSLTPSLPSSPKEETPCHVANAPPCASP